MAWLAGAEVRDLEFVQFHPTALMLSGAPHFLISEAVRGEGARLHDRHGHSPVAHLPGGDLAPRDEVSRALARHMREQGVDHLWLDLRPVGGKRLESQFPTILARCRELGLAPWESSIPGGPGAHYWMGGVSTDLQAATSLVGLYAVGEVACTGVHGANRLASNSLMECLVFARQLRDIALSPLPPPPALEPCHHRLETALAPLRDIAARILTLRQLCWDVAGVERQGRDLRAALAIVRRERQEFEQDPLLRQAHELEPGHQLDLTAGNRTLLLRLQELRQRLVVAELLMSAAEFRSESRGGHFRTDAPSNQPFWCRHTIQMRGQPLRTSNLGTITTQHQAGNRSAQPVLPTV